MSVPDWPMDSSEGAASSGRLGLLQGLMLKLLPRFWSAQVIIDLTILYQKMKISGAVGTELSEHVGTKGVG